MKVKTETKLILDDDFDDAIKQHIQRCRDANTEEYDQELINLIRSRVHRAFKLGLEINNDNN